MSGKTTPATLKVASCTTSMVLCIRARQTLTTKVPAMQSPTPPHRPITVMAAITT